MKGSTRWYEINDGVVMAADSASSPKATPMSFPTTSSVRGAPAASRC
jgi:hypothetical protein